MKFAFNSLSIEKQQADCIIIGVFEEMQFTKASKMLNQLTDHQLENILKQSHFQGKIGQTLWIYQLPGLSISRILIVGCGKNEPLSATQYRKIIAQSTKALQGLPLRKAVSYLLELPLAVENSHWQIKQTIECMEEALYRFDTFKSKPEPSSLLSNVILWVPEKTPSATLKKAAQEGISIAAGVKYTKDLANLPSNICTPSYLAKEAKQLAKQSGRKVTARVLEEKDIRELGMGAFLAVTQGSATPPKFIILTYHGTNKKEAPTVLVGKGITFDTGGLSLKPADSMVGMKYDMCGAATVLGCIKAAADCALPMTLIGIIAAAENMPSGAATKPEDIVTSLSGQTIEILNTDAEGRLVLCDALTYCERFKPAAVIDIATLTGAVVIALGHHASGLLGNHEPLTQALLQAGETSGDRAWHMPLWEEYQEQLKSPFADMSNVGGRAAGTITAACFLSRFTQKFHWAHLDVAGTAAMMTGHDRYASGRPVPLLMQYLINQCQQKKSES